MKKTAIVVCGVKNHIILINKLKARGFYTILVDGTENPVAKEAADEFAMIDIFDFDAIKKFAKERNVDLANGIGKKLWLIPDCELPPEGEGVLKGHESVIIVNDSDEEAKIKVTVYFDDKDKYENIEWVVGAGRVRCFRMNNLDDMCGYKVPLETQYAMKLVSNCNIVVQYGRLDNRQTNLAYYTTMAYSE